MSLGAAGVTWSRRAAAAPAITHCVAHPYPRAAERIFPWGLLASRRRGLLTALLLGIPPARTRNLQAPCPSHGAHFSLLPTRELPSLRPPGAPIESRLGPARRGQLSLGEVRGLQALQLLPVFPPAKPGAEAGARGAPEEAG